MRRTIGSQVRVWTPPDTPSRRWQPAELTVEWRFIFTIAPSTYGLLGGFRTTGPTTFDLRGPSEPFRDSLADGPDKAAFGLPDEYRAHLLLQVPTGLAVTVAAHGIVGSSPRVFASLARVLLELFGRAESATDVEIAEVFSANTLNVRLETE